MCLAVAKSTQFKDISLEYPDKDPDFCYVHEVSFKRTRDEEKGAESAPRSFYERLLPCRFPKVWPRNEEAIFYISRAYRSNQVFVYSRDPESRKIYPRNISTDVDIVDELNIFDFVED